MASRADVRILVAGKDLYQAKSWEIESNMMQPADAFSISIPNPDGTNKGKINKFDAVQVLVDETVQMSGYVDDLNYSGDASSGATIEIIGRDAFGQLLDTSATPGTLTGMDLQQIAKKLSTPFVTSWVVDNELNRAKLTAAKRKLGRLKYYVDGYDRMVADGAIVSQSTDSGVKSTKEDRKRLAQAAANYARLRAIVFPRTKVAPGEAPLEVIERTAQKTEMMVWLAADGVGVIARPNYTQQPLYKINLYPLSSPLSASNNVISWSIADSGRELFASYRLVGSSANTSDTYAAGSHHDEASTDANVSLARHKIINGSGQNAKQSKLELKRDKQQRQFNALTLNYTVQGHTQAGRIWQVDTIVSVEDQINGFSGPFFLSKRRFTGSKDGGQKTEIELHAPGVLLP